MVHANDLAFDLDQQLLEGLRGRPAFFGRQVGKAGVLLQLRHKVPHRRGRPRQKQVDALLRQQHSALELQAQRLRQQTFSQDLNIV